MLTIVIFLAVLCVVLITMLVTVSIFASRCLSFVFTLESQIEKSLDMLDARYRRLYDVLQIPVASDDPTTQNVISEIKGAKQDLLVIANMIIDAGFSTDEDVGEENE